MTEVRFKKSYLMLATVFLAICGFFVYKFVNATVLGDPITGLDVPDNVLQMGETETRTATTTEDGASDWTSSASSTVATIDAITGIVEAIGEGTTTIAYATSTSGFVNSIEITVYAAAVTDNPAIGTVQVGEGDVTPTSFTAAGAGETIAWQSSNTDIATIIALTGVITPVEEGTTTISYEVEEDATGRIVAKGSLEITVEEAEPTLESIAITTPADVLLYTVGDDLDITGLVVTGTYSDDSTSTETVTVDDVTGFDSSEPENDQVLTITVGSQTTTFTVDIIAIPITAIGDITGTPQFGVELTAGALTPADATVTYQWFTAGTFDGTYTEIDGATLSTYTPGVNDVTKFLKVVATGTGNYSGTVTSAATELGVATVPVTAIGAISGTAQVDEELTAGALTPLGATATYQWKRANTSGGTYTNISGATLITYTLTASDQGKYVKVSVTGTGGYSGTVTSAASDKVAARSGGHSIGGGTSMPRTGTLNLSIEQMQATVNSLLAQINALIAQMNAKGIQLGGTSGASGAGSGITLSAVVRPLFLGRSGADVRALQNFLISQNKGLAAAALKNHGATNYFGLLTKAALAEFQAGAGLPATGYFGPLTKAYLKNLGF